MLGALGGVTVVSILLVAKVGAKPGIVLFWMLFALVASLHSYGVPV